MVAVARPAGTEGAAGLTDVAAALAPGAAGFEGAPLPPCDPGRGGVAGEAGSPAAAPVAVGPGAVCVVGVVADRAAIVAAEPTGIAVPLALTAATPGTALAGEVGVAAGPASGTGTVKEGLATISAVPSVPSVSALLLPLSLVGAELVAFWVGAAPMFGVS